MIIFKQALKRILKNKIRVLILLILPVLFVLLFVAGDRKTGIGFVDRDQTMLSRKLAEDIGKIDGIKVIHLDENQIYDKTVSFQMDYSIIIEKGFQSDILSGKEPDVRDFYLEEKEKTFYVKAAVEDYVRNMELLASSAGFDRSRFDSVLKLSDDSSLKLTGSSSEDADRLPRSRGAIGFMIQFMIYMSVITAGLILEDKSSGIFYRVFFAPVTLKRYILENLAVFLMTGVLQVTVLLALLGGVFGFDFGKNPLGLYLLLVVFSVVCISLGLWLVSMFKKPMHAYLTILIVATPLVMLGGCYWPMDMMPEAVRTAARFLPTSWVMQGVDKLLYNSAGILDLVPQILILFVFAGIFMAAGLYRKVDIAK